MRKLKRTAQFLLAMSASSTAFANGFSTYLETGWVYADFQDQQSIYVHPSVENRYSTAGTNAQFYGGGAAYQWDQIFAKAPHMALNLGLTVYHFQTTLHGISEVGINLAPPGVAFDTLNYSINQSSTALMLEPKLIYTATTWQPYILAGIGVDSNSATNFTETPNGSTVPNTTPFSNNSENDLAYSVGVGVQHKLITIKNGDSFSMAMEYRYMNWGVMKLGTFPGQRTGEVINYGQLKTSLVGVNLIWNF